MTIFLECEKFNFYRNLFEAAMNTFFALLLSISFITSIFGATNVNNGATYAWEGGTNSIAVDLGKPTKNFCITFEANPPAKLYMGLYSDTYNRQVSSTWALVSQDSQTVASTTTSKKTISSIVEIVYGEWTATNTDRGAFFEQRTVRPNGGMTGSIRQQNTVSMNYLSATPTTFRSYRYTVSLTATSFSLNLSCLNTTTNEYDTILSLDQSNFTNFTMTDTRFPALASQTESFMTALNKSTFSGFTKVGFLCGLNMPYTVRNIQVINYDVVSGVRAAITAANTQAAARQAETANFYNGSYNYVFDPTTNKHLNTIITDIQALATEATVTTNGLALPATAYLNANPLPTISSPQNAIQAATITTNALAILNTETTRANNAKNYGAIIQRAIAFNADYSNRLNQLWDIRSVLRLALDGAIVALNKVNPASTQYAEFKTQLDSYTTQYNTFTSLVSTYSTPSLTNYSAMATAAPTFTAANVTTLSQTINATAATNYQTIVTAAQASVTAASQNLVTAETLCTNQMAALKTLTVTLNELDNSIAQKQDLLNQAATLSATVQNNVATIAQQKPTYTRYATDGPFSFTSTYVTAANAKQAADNLTSLLQSMIQAGIPQINLAIQILSSKAPLLTVAQLFARLRVIQLQLSTSVPTELNTTKQTLFTTYSKLFNDFQTKANAFGNVGVLLQTANNYQIPISLANASVVNSVYNSTTQLANYLTGTEGQALIAQLTSLEASVAQYQSALDALNVQIAAALTAKAPEANAAITAAATALNTALPIATTANTAAAAAVTAAQGLPDLVTNKASLIAQAQGVQNNKQTPASGTQVTLDYLTTTAPTLPKTPKTYTSIDQATADITAMQAIKTFADLVVTNNSAILNTIATIQKTIDDAKNSAIATQLTQAINDANAMIANISKAVQVAQDSTKTANAMATDLIAQTQALPDGIIDPNSQKTKAQVLNDLQAVATGTIVINNANVDTMTYLNSVVTPPALVATDTSVTVASAQATAKSAQTLVIMIIGIRDKANGRQLSILNIGTTVKALQAIAKADADLKAKSQEATAAIAATIDALNQVIPLAKSANTQVEAALAAANALPEAASNKADLISQARTLQNNGKNPATGTQITLDYLTTTLTTLPVTAKTYTSTDQAIADITAMQQIKVFIDSVTTSNATILKAIDDLNKALKEANNSLVQLKEAIDKANGMIANVPLITQQAKESTKIANDIAADLIKQTEALADGTTDPISQKTKDQLISDLQKLATGTVLVDNAPVDTATYLDKVVAPQSLSPTDTAITIEAAQRAYKSAETLVSAISVIKDKANERGMTLKGFEPIIKALHDANAAAQEAAIAAKSQEAITAITDTIKLLNEALPLATEANTQVVAAITAATALPESVTKKAELVAQARAFQNNGQTPASGTQLTVDYLNNAVKTLQSTTQTYTSIEQATVDIDACVPIKTFVDSVKTNHAALMTSISDLNKVIEEAKNTILTTQLSDAIKDANAMIANVPLITQQAKESTKIANDLAIDLKKQTEALPNDAVDPTSKKTKPQILNELTQLISATITVDNAPVDTTTYLDKVITPPNLSSSDSGMTIETAQAAKKTAELLVIAICEVKDKANDRVATLRGFEAIIKSLQAATPVTPTPEAPVTPSFDEAALGTKSQEATTAITDTIKLLNDLLPLATEANTQVSAAISAATALPDTITQKSSLVTQATALQNNNQTPAAGTQVTLDYLNNSLKELPTTAKTYTTLDQASADIAAMQSIKAFVDSVKGAHDALMRTISDLQKTISSAPTTATNTKSADTTPTVDTLAAINQSAQTSYNEIKQELVGALTVAKELNEAASKVIARAQALPTASPNRDSLIKTAEFIQDDKAVEANGTQVNVTYLTEINAAFSGTTKTYATVEEAQKDIDTATAIKTKIKEITESKSVVLKSITDVDTAITAEQTAVTKQEQIATASTQLSASVTKAAALATSTRAQSTETKAIAISTLNAATNLPSSLQQRQSLIDQVTMLQTGNTKINNVATDNDEYLKQVDTSLPKLPVTSTVLEDITVMADTTTAIINALQTISSEVTTRQAKIKSLADSIATEQNTTDTINGQLAISTTAARRASTEATANCDAAKTIVTAINGQATTALSTANNLIDDAIDPASQKSKKMLIDELTKITTGTITIDEQSTETLSYLTRIRSTLPPSTVTFTSTDEANAQLTMATKIKTNIDAALAEANARLITIQTLQQNITGAQQASASTLASLSQQANALIAATITALNNAIPLAQITVTQSADALALLKTAPTTLSNPEILTTTAQKNQTAAQTTADYLTKTLSAFPTTTQTYTTNAAAQKDIDSLKTAQTFLDQFMAQNDALVKSITDNRIAITSAIAATPKITPNTKGPLLSVTDAQKGLVPLADRITALTTRLNIVLTGANGLPPTAAANWIKNDGKKRQGLLATTMRSLKALQTGKPSVPSITTFITKTNDMITLQEKTITQLETSLKTLQNTVAKTAAANSGRR
jgi:hypothetical protein